MKMKRETRLYNVLLPIWLLILFPSWLWLLLIPGNLAVDCLVTFLTLCALKHGSKRAVLGEIWWSFWLLGFAADAVGLAWMFLGWLGGGALSNGSDRFSPLAQWGLAVSHVGHNAFLNPWAFLWTLVGVAMSGVCIYFFDKLAMKDVDALDKRQKHIVALTMAIVTAPWLYFIPVY